MGRIQVTLPDDLEAEARACADKNFRTIQNLIVLSLSAEVNRRKKRHLQAVLKDKDNKDPV
jgi:hypothetical protein